MEANSAYKPMDVNRKQKMREEKDTQNESNEKGSTGGDLGTASKASLLAEAWTVLLPKHVRVPSFLRLP